MVFAVESEPSTVHGIDIEEGWRPVGDFLGHASEFLFAEREGNARLVHEEAVPQHPLFEVQPAIVAAHAAAARRGEDGPS